jgi:FkbM family methyltransferase
MTIEEEFKESIDVWMRENLEELRYNYNLNRNSIVFDVGFYKGEFTGRIFRSYNCNIYAFEPVEKFYMKGLANFPNKKIHLFNYGLGNKDEIKLMSIQEDSSSLFKFENIIDVQIKSFLNVLYCELDKHINFIDLIKINIEGAEYDLLDYMLDFEIVNICKNIQIQFHTFVENAKERRDIIRERLIVTHKETYNFPYVWENWTLK